MKKKRIILNNQCPIQIIETFKKMFSYNPETGIITNTITKRVYNSIHTKGYINDITYQLDNIEYNIKYHRLCWLLYYNVFVEDDLQIDHINNIKTDNRIINLRKCENNLNIKKKLPYKNCTSEYKGVSKVKDYNQYGKEYNYYISKITINKKSFNIGRFKNEILAAIFYDSANRFYFKDYSLTNFEKSYLMPMNIEDLRKEKKNKLTIINLTNEILKDFQ